MILLLALICTSVGIATGWALATAWRTGALEDERARGDRLERMLVQVRHQASDDPTGRLLADVRAQGGRHRRGVRRG